MTVRSFGRIIKRIDFSKRQIFSPCMRSSKLRSQGKHKFYSTYFSTHSTKKSGYFVIVVRHMTAYVKYSEALLYSYVFVSDIGSDPLSLTSQKIARKICFFQLKCSLIILHILFNIWFCWIFCITFNKFKGLITNKGALYVSFFVVRISDVLLC